jgi:hypothetical protein
MKRLSTFLLLLTTSLLPACDGGSSPPAVSVVPTFTGDGFTLTADADKAYSDRPVTFMARCTTVVNGKGRILFIASGDYPRSEIYLKSPIVAMLIRDSIPEISIPMVFVANQPIAMPIRCRLQPGISCFYHAAVIVDSVFVADSNRYFDVDSDIAHPLSAKGYGYIWELPSKGGPQALYRP